MVSKRTQILLAVPIAVVVMATSVLLRRDKPTGIPTESPIRIDIHVIGLFLNATEDYEASITNQADCVAVSKTLSLGRKERPHMCAPVGSMTFFYSNGASNVVSLRTGHNDGRYEIELNGRYSIPRAGLSEALSKAGIDKSKLLLGH